MDFDSRNQPQFGSTDWAARQFRRILDREERSKKDTSRSTGHGTSRNETVQQVAQNISSAQTPPALSVADLWRLPQRLMPKYARNIRSLGDFNPLPPEARNEFGTDALDAIRLTSENRRAMIRRMIDEHEGGYVNDPNDAGGPTNYGVTAGGLKEFHRLLGIGPQAAQDAATQREATVGTYAPENIARQEAEDIHDILMRGSKIDMIADPALREQLFDMTVNMGAAVGPGLFLDALEDLGYKVRSGPTDNAIGSRSLSVIRDLARSGDVASLTRLNSALVDRRRAYYEDRVATRHANRKYRRGWLNRANSFRILPTGDQR